MSKVRRSRVTGAASRLAGSPMVCESLEPRLLMSGNVTVVVKDGTLDVLGDRFANQITIDQTGLGTGQFRVSPADGDTTINGQSQPQIFDDASNMWVRLGRGADSLTLKGLTLESATSLVMVRLNMGDGRDTLVFNNDAFFCRVIADLGAGNDTVKLDTATTFQMEPPAHGIITPAITFGLPPPAYKIYGGGGWDKLVAVDSTALKNNRGFFRDFSRGQVVPTNVPVVPTPGPTDPIDPILPSGHIVCGPTWTAQQQLAAGNTDFAFDLYHQLESQDGNIFFSPLSISAAMSMLYAGAGGQTADQIAQTMSFLLPYGDFAGAFGTLLNTLAATSGDNSTLDIANSMWGQKDFAFLDSYLQTLKSDFQSEMQQVDFISDPEAQRTAINQWVSDHTDQMIQNLFPQGSITDATRLVLANAIYFNAQWEYSFDASATNQQAFHLAGGDVNVNMMHQTEDYQYFDGGNFQAVEIPYQGNKSMIVLLPVAGQFQQFDSSLTAAEVQAIENGMTTTNVNLSLPKFGYEQKTDLSSTLANMGITDAFNSQLADLSGIDGKKDLYVTDVVHQAKIEVSEKGTKAAAATGIAVGTCCEEGPPPQPVNFTVDHPFVYLIKDNTTNSTLFVGRVSDATAFA